MCDSSVGTTAAGRFAILPGSAEAVTVYPVGVAVVERDDFVAVFEAGCLRHLVRVFVDTRVELAEEVFRLESL